MKKRSYINKNTGKIKEFAKGKKPAGDEWEYLPPMSRFINEDGKFVLRIQLEDATVDIIENETPTEGEVVENGNPSAN